jgi:hypothetical protein
MTAQPAFFLHADSDSSAMSKSELRIAVLTLAVKGIPFTPVPSGICFDTQFHHGARVALGEAFPAAAHRRRRQPRRKRYNSRGGVNNDWSDAPDKDTDASYYITEYRKAT